MDHPAGKGAAVSQHVVRPLMTERVFQAICKKELLSGQAVRSAVQIMHFVQACDNNDTLACVQQQPDMTQAKTTLQKTPLHDAYLQ